MATSKIFQTVNLTRTHAQLRVEVRDGCGLIDVFVVDAGGRTLAKIEMTPPQAWHLAENLTLANEAAQETTK